MLAAPLVVAAAFAYLLLLFAIAEFAGRRAATRVRCLAAHRLEHAQAKEPSTFGV